MTNLERAYALTGVSVIGDNPEGAVLALLQAVDEERLARIAYLNAIVAELPVSQVNAAHLAAQQRLQAARARFTIKTDE